MLEELRTVVENLKCKHFYRYDRIAVPAYHRNRFESSLRILASLCPRNLVEK